MVDEVFPSESVFRIDHYLGKETVQNILALRFANQLFEPIWNANYVDHVQITMAEDIGIGGRAGYYDGIGAARDVIQNHLLQLLALVAMEEPISFDADDLRAEKQKVLAARHAAAATSTCTTARGQYAAGWEGGEQGAGLPARRTASRRDSTTETYAAVNLRDRHPPLGGRAVLPAHRQAARPPGHRGGRRLQARRRTCRSRRTATEELGQNALVIRVQPDEGVTLRFGSKVPGTADGDPRRHMDFAYGGAFTESSPEAYERLILDVLLGDPPLFPRHEEVELAWQILDPILELLGRKGGKPGAVPVRRPGARSPPTRCWRRDGRAWRRP